MTICLAIIVLIISRMSQSTIVERKKPTLVVHLIKTCNSNVLISFSRVSEVTKSQKRNCNKTQETQK